MAAREWLDANRGVAPPDYGAICPPELIDAGVAWQRRLLEAGYAGIHWPVEHGGRGLSEDHQAAWLVECARAGVPPVLNMVGLVLAGGAILRYGTPAQQDQHLRATLGADHVWCQLFSEPGAGSDLGSLATRAERDGDHFVVNGQKVWCSGGRVSNWGILMARTDPDARKHDGISFFLCPMDLPGIEVRPLRQMTGSAEFDEVFFTDVSLPADLLLGPLHGGWGVGMSVLMNERGHIGTAVISLERRLAQFSSLGSDRQLDARGAPAAGVTRWRRDRLPVACPAWRVGLAAQARHHRDDVRRGHAARRDGRCRRRCSTALTRPACLAAPGGRIAGGTSQIQRTIIGERLLGLPREPKG